MSFGNRMTRGTLPTLEALEKNSSSYDFVPRRDKWRSDTRIYECSAIPDSRNASLVCVSLALCKYGITLALLDKFIIITPPSRSFRREFPLLEVAREEHYARNN